MFKKSYKGELEIYEWINNQRGKLIFKGEMVKKGSEWRVSRDKLDGNYLYRWTLKKDIREI